MGTRRIVLRALPVSTGILAVFFAMSSRPTADEYLLAPTYSGFYVDIAPKLLFEPDPNPLIRYFQGARAMVRLGWDSWINASTFQMGSGWLTNYLGPFATVFLSVVLSGISLLLIHSITSHIWQGLGPRWTPTAFFYLVLATSMSVGNFNTSRKNFGLFPFLGIRFGLYLVHALLLVSVFLKLLKEADSDRNVPSFGMCIRLTLTTCFMSLWYVMYLLIFQVSRILILWLGKKKPHYYIWTLFLTFSSAAISFDFFQGSQNRTSLSSQSIVETIKLFISEVFLNSNSRLYGYELWSTVLGVHSIASFAAGVLGGLLFSYDYKLSHMLERATKISLPAILILPPVFLLQEYLTYEAWWHRTTPISLSIVAFFFLGVKVSVTLSKTSTYSRIAFATKMICIVLLVGLVLPFSSHLVEVNNFRSQWDDGNILGIGSPVENNEDYNVINVLKTAPYAATEWDVQSRIFESIYVDVKQVVELQNELAPGGQRRILKISTSSSSFDHYIGGQIRFRLLIDSGELSSYQVQVDGSIGNSLQTAHAGNFTINTGLMSQPGTLIVSSKNNRSVHPDILIETFEIGLTGEIQRRFAIDSKDYRKKL